MQLRLDRLARGDFNYLIDSCYAHLVEKGGLIDLRRLQSDLITFYSNRLSRHLSSSAIVRRYQSYRNWQIQREFTQLFSGDFLTRAICLSYFNNHTLIFPVNRPLKNLFESNKIHLSVWLSHAAWLIYKLGQKMQNFNKIQREVPIPYSLYQDQTGLRKVLILGEPSVASWDAAKYQDHRNFAKWFFRALENNLLPRSISQFKGSFSLGTEGRSTWYSRSIFYHSQRNFLVRTLKRFESSQTILVVIPSSLGVMRPAWTYSVSSNIVFLYIHLTSYLDPRLTASEPRIDPTNVLTWQNQYKPAEITDELMQRISATKNEGFSRVPWWTDLSPTSTNLPVSKSRNIAVFDVEPIMNWYGISTLNDLKYNSFIVRSEWLRAIIHSCDELGFRVLHKRKRVLTKKENTEYLRFLQNLHIDFPKTYLQVHPTNSPSRIIELSKGVISAPFTSTHQIARDIGKPCAYFDVTAKIDLKINKEVSGPVLRSKSELEDWLKNL